MPPDKQFTEFLKTAPAASDVLSGKTAVVTGNVYRADAADKFVFASAEGQTTELPIDAVQRFKVLDQAGLNAVVQIEVVASHFGAGAFTIKEIIKEPISDTRKELIKDPIFDTRKEIIKEPIKEPIWDPQGTLWSDPPGGTLREGIDVGDPGQQVVNPAVGVQQQFVNPAFAMQQQGGMSPFIMATPHHASAAMLAQQPGAQLASTLVAETVAKGVNTDHIYDQITRKELIKEIIWDTHKEPIFDPITRWEGGAGTVQEGVGNPGQGVDPPIWGLPGMMF